MHESDFDSFQSMLDAVSGMLSKGRYVPSAEHTAVFFNAVRHLSLEQVSAAFSAHVKDPERGKFAPVPADVIEQVGRMLSNERPGVEEAWAMLPASEDDTIVWTAEMAEAHAACAPLLADGDKIAARMTFKEVYAKAVTKAVAAGVPVSWSASLGWDMEKRKRVLAAAVEAGKLPAIAAREECPALPLTTGEKLLLPNTAPAKRENFRQKISELANAFRDGNGSDPLDWARELKRRDEAGEPISVGLRDAWKNALHDRPDDSGLFGGFTPIPNDVLPPAMRKGAA